MKTISELFSLPYLKLVKLNVIKGPHETILAQSNAIVSVLVDQKWLKIYMNLAKLNANLKHTIILVWDSDCSSFIYMVTVTAASLSQTVSSILAWDYITFFMLDSAEQEILNARKYKKKIKNIKRALTSIFQLIKVEMATIIIVGISTFMSGKISCLAKLSIFITSGPCLQLLIKYTQKYKVWKLD